MHLQLHQRYSFYTRIVQRFDRCISQNHRSMMIQMQFQIAYDPELQDFQNRNGWTFLTLAAMDVVGFSKRSQMYRWYSAHQ